ncbi:MAG: cytochrome c-type biogenesis protein CcmH [Alphaproteobacteria bacterium]|nr:cytochrome c-type biogenesis protein CcmH [Alphaproteobacteria bacterium]
MVMLLLSFPAYAIDAGEQLADPVLEARAVALGDQLRCVVCQSESINDSPAGIAKDLRSLVREKLKAGLGDAQILEFVHARYGDYVLLNPPVKNGTLALWLGPWVFLGIGFGLFALIVLNNTVKDKG